MERRNSVRLKIPRDEEDPLQRRLEENHLPYQVSTEMVRGIIKARNIEALLAAYQEGKLDSRPPQYTTSPPPKPGKKTEHPNASLEAYLEHIALTQSAQTFERVYLVRGEIKALDIRKKDQQVDISVLAEHDESKIIFSFFEILKKVLSKIGKVVELEVPLAKPSDLEMVVSRIRFYCEKIDGNSDFGQVEVKLYRDIEKNRNVRITAVGSGELFVAFKKVIAEENLGEFCEEK